MLEICCANIASALNAQAGGADRIELCDNLWEGGTTPSFGMFKVLRQELKIQIFVLIRPRGGDFLYSDAEFKVMLQDIYLAKELGADGIAQILRVPFKRIELRPFLSVNQVFEDPNGGDSEKRCNSDGKGS